MTHESLARLKTDHFETPGNHSDTYCMKKEKTMHNICLLKSKAKQFLPKKQPYLTYTDNKQEVS